MPDFETQKLPLEEFQEAEPVDPDEFARRVAEAPSSGQYDAAAVQEGREERLYDQGQGSNPASLDEASIEREIAAHPRTRAFPGQAYRQSSASTRHRPAHRREGWREEYAGDPSRDTFVRESDEDVRRRQEAAEKVRQLSREQFGRQ